MIWLVKVTSNEISHARHYLTVMQLGVCGIVSFGEWCMTDFCPIIWHFTVCSNNSFSKKHSTLRQLYSHLFRYLFNTHERTATYDDLTTKPSPKYVQLTFRIYMALVSASVPRWHAVREWRSATPPQARQYAQSWFDFRRTRPESGARTPPAFSYPVHQQTSIKPLLR